MNASSTPSSGSAAAAIGGSRIAGVGHADPKWLVENAVLEAELGLEPGWIERRTGIRRRRICGPEETTSSLAEAAARVALDRAEVEPGELGFVVLATSTPDELLPPTGPVLAERLGSRAGAVDLAGACTGFVSALALGESYCCRHAAPVLVVAANLLSRRVDPADAGARAIFADGAGAVILVPDRTPCLLSVALSSDGSQANLIRIPAGGATEPTTRQAIEEGRHYLRMANGARVFGEAVGGMVRAGQLAAQRAGLETASVDHWIPHQANARILERAGARLNINPDRWVSVLAERGNSSAATIPTALSVAAAEGRLDEGDTILLTAVGAGLLHAGAVLRWGKA